MPATPSKKTAVWTPTKVQFLYRHRNRRYYVRVFTGGKEKWTSLKTKLMSVAKNRMKGHLDAAERQRSLGEGAVATGSLTFGQALETYRKRLSEADVRPNTKAYRDAGVKLVLRSWEGVGSLNVRKVTSKMVEEWLRKFKASAQPHIPKNAKRPAHNSTGASITTIKCALDAVRHVLDVSVESGHLYANPARNTTVANTARKMFKTVRRAKAERGVAKIPTREEFLRIVDTIRTAGVADCRAAAEFVQFIAFCGARKTEANNVRWSDIDFSAERIRLRVTKNGEERSVPMTGEMQLLLETMHLRRGPSLNESVLLVKEAQGFIDTACRKLGLSRFTTHALRHLFGTACLEAGVDVRTVASWLGHKDNGALLLKVYSHVRREHEAEMIRKVSFASAGTDKLVGLERSA